MTLATLVVMVICMKLGLWQYNKAQTKLAQQQQLENSMLVDPVDLPKTITEEWRYKRVRFSGTYEPRYQVLIDNQVEKNVVGYHVLTPVRLESSNSYVLVNRGWIAGTLDRKLPVVKAPEGRQEITGDIYIPLAKFFTLEAPQPVDGRWQTVWQNMDMQRYAKTVSFEVRPFVVRLDPLSKAGGYTRNWPRPGERVNIHLGYAYQWFGFALTLFVIYVVLNVKKVKS